MKQISGKQVAGNGLNYPRIGSNDTFEPEEFQHYLPLYRSTI
jgi:hypothetical protein